MIDILLAATVTRLKMDAPPPPMPQPNAFDALRLAALLGFILAGLAFSVLQ